MAAIRFRSFPRAATGSMASGSAGGRGLAIRGPYRRPPHPSRAEGGWRAGRRPYRFTPPPSASGRPGRVPLAFVVERLGPPVFAVPGLAPATEEQSKGEGLPHAAPGGPRSVLRGEGEDNLADCLGRRGRTTRSRRRGSPALGRSQASGYKARWGDGEGSITRLDHKSRISARPSGLTYSMRRRWRCPAVSRTVSPTRSGKPSA